MVNKEREEIIYNKKSIYHDLKEFYSRNSEVLYSYQDFEIAGIKEFRVTTNKIRSLLVYEKNRLSNELMKIFFENVEIEEKMKNIYEYLTLNPIINYYESFIKNFKDSIEIHSDLYFDIKEIVKRILLNSEKNEEIKLGIIISPFCELENIKEILEVLSIHNDFVFYVIKAYEYMGNFNNIIFQMAKKSYGYGKVFCVMNIRPTTYEIRKWMIEEGSNNNVGVTELLSYNMLSLELLEYLENVDFDKDILEVFSKAFSMLLSEYGIDDIKDSVKVCNKLIEVINQVNGGIYSLYSAVSMIYSIEAAIIDEYKNRKSSYKFNDDYKRIIEACKKICEQDFWHGIIAKEVGNIEIESSVLICCAEKIKYKLKKKEFEMILKRDYTNALLYKYAFSVGNKSVKKCAYKLGLEMLPMDKILRGQDELKIENLAYDDIEQICYFIIIKYAKYDEFKEQYKELNLQALRSPLIETRSQAAANLQIFKGEFDSLDKELISDLASSEMVMSIRRTLNSLVVKSNNKMKKYVEVSENMHIEPHVKDIYLITLNIEGTENIDMSEVYNKIFEDNIIYLKREKNNLEDKNSIEIITVEGYVIGYIPKENSIILKNLLEKGKYIYGKINNISEDYNSISIQIYLSYKDIIEEITSTLSLLSGEKEYYLQ